VDPDRFAQPAHNAAACTMLSGLSAVTTFTYSLEVALIGAKEDGRGCGVALVRVAMSGP
jgi:hypothetical protein